MSDPAQAEAWRLVALARRRGELKPPKFCEECGDPSWYATLESAHYDYARPLDVRWLCRGCHVRWDLQGHDGRPPAARTWNRPKEPTTA